MPARISIVAIFTIGVAMILSAPAALADIVRLTNGGVLRGTLAEQSDDAAEITITLLTGGKVTLSRSSVATTEQRPVIIEEYETRAAKLLLTLDAHWEMAEWCRANDLDQRRSVHLEEVLRFDPEHRKAHYGLGHTNYRNEWLTRDEYDQRRRDEGFVKYDGKWIAAENLKSIRAKDVASKAELAWYPKIRIWMKQATGSNPTRAGDGLANLNNVRSADAVPALIQFLGKSDVPNVRQLFVKITAKIGGPRVAGPLAAIAIRDNVRTLRDEARTSIPKDHIDTAQDYFISALRDEKNFIIRRAALALAKSGDEKAVAPLIRALNTTHSYKMRVPVQGYALGSEGSFATGGSGSLIPPQVIAGIRMGIYDDIQVIPLFRGAGAQATKEVPFALEHQNAEVLAALKAITKSNFGFDERAWLRWWNVTRHQTKTAPDLP